MEPFDLTFHQVTSDDDLKDPSKFDSFSNVINYDTSFDSSGVSLPLSCYNTDTAQYTWKDYTYSAASGIQTTSGGVPTGNSFQHQSVWCDTSQGSPPHRTFLIHPDGFLGDSLSAERESSSVPVTTAQQQLKILAQISANTSAVGKKGKRIQKFVARTVTSPSTPIPPPPSTMSQQARSTPNSQTLSSPPSLGSSQKAAEPSAEDNSFETVAEALKLQWSVIGNKSLAPAPPDVVAQIVAQAEQKIKTGDSSPLPGNYTPTASPTLFTCDKPTILASPEPSPVLQPVPIALQEIHRDDCQRELMRVIPTEITTEKPSSGTWFSAAGKSLEKDTSSKGSIESPVHRSRTTGSTPTTPLSPFAEKQPWIGDMLSSPRGGPSLAAGEVLSATATGVKTVENWDTVSEASYSSEMEMEKYLQAPLSAAGLTNYQLESEEFLRSLPPIKPINLDAYAPLPPLLPPQPMKTKEKKQKSAALTTSNVRKKVVEGQQAQNGLANKFSAFTSGQSTPGNFPQHPITSTPQLSSTVSTPSGSSLSDRVVQRDSDITSIPKDSSRDLFFSPHLSPISEDSPVFATPEQSTLFHSASGSTPMPSSGSYDKKQFDEILRQKAKLQGQLEILTEESQSMLQERAELQAQLTALKAKLSTAQGAEAGAGGDNNLRKEVENLRTSRQLLEQTILDANRLLSEKAEEIRALQDELQAAQDTANKLQVRSQEMRDDMRAKDMNVQALKNKIAELYVEVQTSIQAKMEAETEARTSRNDLVSLVKAKEWYQEQLQLAHEVRSKLQRELTVLQGQSVSHGTIVERLKTDSGRLRQQLSDMQQRALRDKEGLARHLEAIQSDMMEREAAFLEIQRERKMYEDTFNTQVLTVEEEKSRMASLQQATNDLEAQLDRASGEAKKRHEELISMETGQMETMKRLAVAEESLVEKEKSLQEMEQRLIQMESQLQAVMSDLTKKDNEILSLKEEKASTEIALRSALQEKASVDRALEVLKTDMGKVEISFKQMKQELGVRVTELEQMRVSKEHLQEELDRSQHELDIKSRSVDAMTRSADGQSATQHQLEGEKARLEGEKNELRLRVQVVQQELNEKTQAVAEATLTVEKLTVRVSELEAMVAKAKDSVPVDKIKIYEGEIEDLRLRIKVLEETEREEANSLDLEREQMHTEIARLKRELLDRQKAYDENVDVLDKKLKELTVDKQQLETELGIARRSQELSQLEERDSFAEEIQNLATELKRERDEKYDLEQQLLTLQAQKVAEVETLQQRLTTQMAELDALNAQRNLLVEANADNQRLELELEKEKGRVMGLSQKNAKLKEHSHQVESALAQRESALADLRCTVEDSGRHLEERDAKFLDRISGLETAVEKEVEVQRELRKQMGTKIMENKRVKKQNEGIREELEQLKKDLSASQQAATLAMADLETANQMSQMHLTEARESSAQARALEGELERVKRDLSDNLARQPVLLEQIQNLEWQCNQKSKEVKAAQEQIQIAESRAQEEVEAMKISLQTKQTEVESLLGELSSLRQEKAQQRSQVNELRGALKASVQHHKLTKRLNENGSIDKSVQANIERKVVIPPLPFDLASVEQLIQDTKVTPLDSKPLDQLSSCLTSLRAEISGLQKQMDIHTTAVHTSNQSWRTVQSDVDDLNEVMRTIANTIIAANSTRTITMATAVDREQAEILHV
ncbi:golgin subfamily A member 3 [Aplysia californica]|uniref:Golgin subfamily A member 3 n=1 Tax=Aplysia californica TaxID=6500 RepID=A0ABM1VXG2_APLCA|nr:golgin subfamily A member 3 [Aplysia californica]